MGLFTTPPKRVTQKELDGRNGIFEHERGVYGEMKTGEDYLKPEKFKVFKSIVEGSMANKDHYKGNDYSGIMSPEIDEIKKQMEDSGHFNERQITKAVKHLSEKL